MTADRIISALLTVLLAVMGGVIKGAQDDIGRARAEIVELRIRQESFATHAQLADTVREMREDMTTQIKTLRDDMPGIVRGALSRTQEQRRER